LRYFIEVAYDGFEFSGFQIQNNAVTIQGELTKALSIILRSTISLTGSSRTDAQVNAYQNFFHFDYSNIIPETIIYNCNAVLPSNIVVKSIKQVISEAHARFSATSRLYCYAIHLQKNPFLHNRSYYFPYTLDKDRLIIAASLILNNLDFANFSKHHTQVNNFNCSIYKSEWLFLDENIQYYIEGNRFLRGMVRGLVGTMLQLAQHKISINDFELLLTNKSTNIKCNFATPGYGLFLKQVKFPQNIFL
jgi:tRNA pseudouridine38-40 synthase